MISDRIKAMKKRTLIDSLPVMAAARLATVLRPRPGRKKYTAVLTADLHTDADPYRDRTDILRRAFAGVTKKFGRVNAFVMAGDMTNCGDEKEYRLLQKLTRRYLRAALIVPAFGNHDAWHHSDHPNYEIAWRLFRDCCADFGHKVTENYYACADGYCNFIVLGTERTMHNCTFLSDKQLQWLEAELRRCVKERKTILVINHQCLRNRNGGDDGWEEEGQAAASDRIDALLTEYAGKAKSRVIFVSGHKHALNGNCVERAGENLIHLNLPSFEYGNGKTEEHRGAAAVLEITGRKNANLSFYDFIRQEKISL